MPPARLFNFLQAQMGITLAEDARYPERKDTRDKLAALLHPDSKEMRGALGAESERYVLPDAMMEEEDETSPFQGLAPPIGL